MSFYMLITASFLRIYLSSLRAEYIIIVTAHNGIYMEANVIKKTVMRTYIYKQDIHISLKQKEN